jgi:dipeptidyl aminopeptidase/acylaminoacyl peptidase
MEHWKAGLGTFLMFCFALPIAQSNPFQSRRGFEIADYYRTVFPGSLTKSPEGELVAFTMRKYNLEAGESWSELWIMKPDGSDLRQVTSANHNDTAPVFSPDGKQIVFVSDREGAKSQLFVVPVADPGS